MEKRIFLITGVMASGKSTVSERLAQRLEKSVHLRGDVFRRMIVSGREEMSETPSEEAARQLHMRYDLTAEAAKHYYENGFSVVVQDNYYGRELLYMTEALQGLPLCPVVLCPDAAAVRERERTRGKTGYVGFTVEALHESFLKETPRIGLWLDTSRQTPEETVEEILAYYSRRA